MKDLLSSNRSLLAILFVIEVSSVGLFVACGGGGHGDSNGDSAATSQDPGTAPGDTGAASAGGSYPHTVSNGGVMHGDGISDPMTNCTACHGGDLTGTAQAPSCFSCHDDLWNDPSSGSYPHTVSQNGVMHGDGISDPTSNCTSCHGGSLRGSGRAPSCFKCHDDIWDSSSGAVPSSYAHTVSNGGIMHGVGIADPAANCTTCHGPDLRGSGRIPSCYSCHGDVWVSGSTAPSSYPHTVSNGGVMHGDGIADPAANCTSCHGPDLRGVGQVPSCYSCHGDVWVSGGGSSTPSSYPHTVSNGGIMHGTGFADPAANCTSCHGQDLRGSGRAPSCFSCHSDVWVSSGGTNNAGPSSYPHTRSEHGVMHGDGINNPMRYCTSCHGSNLQGTALAPSCTTCHGDVWNGESDGGD
jgi:hypothetical protein